MILFRVCVVLDGGRLVGRFFLLDPTTTDNWPDCDRVFVDYFKEVQLLGSTGGGSISKVKYVFVCGSMIPS